MNLSEVAYFCAHEADGKMRVSEATYIQSYRGGAARLLDFFEDIPVTSITPVDLKEWQEWLDSRNTSVSTRNTYVRTARAFWNLLRERGVPVCNTEGVFKFKKEAKKPKAIKVGNSVKLIASTGIRDTALLLLARDSARRRGGLMSLCVDDFRIIYDEEIKEFYLIGQVLEKGEKPQILMAYDEAAMAMKLWLSIRKSLLEVLRVYDHGRVFVDTRTGNPLTVEYASGLVSHLSKKAGIPAHEPSSLHSFRHSRAKELLRNLSLPEVRDILGHADIKTTADQYAQNTHDELVEAFFKRGKMR